MGDENEISNLLTEEWQHEELWTFFGEENYNRVRYDNDGNEYHLVLCVRRGAEKATTTHTEETNNE